MSEHTYTFMSNITGDEVEVDADGFEEASHIMFSGDQPYDYTEYELYQIDGKF